MSNNTQKHQQTTLIQQLQLFSVVWGQLIHNKLNIIFNDIPLLPLHKDQNKTIQQAPNFLSQIYWQNKTLTDLAEIGNNGLQNKNFTKIKRIAHLSNKTIKNLIPDNSFTICLLNTFTPSTAQTYGNRATRGIFILFKLVLGLLGFVHYKVH